MQRETLTKGTPKIVKEIKKTVANKPPPMNIGLHEWGKPFGAIDLYISEKALEKMVEHAVSFADKRLEAMGFMIGDVYKYNGKIYTVVKDVATSKLNATAVSVKFDDFTQLMAEMDSIKYDYVLVGWYHSHPGHTCFLSGTDLDTQRKMFKQNYHSVVVIDPINKEIKAYRLLDMKGELETVEEGTSYEERMFAIYSDEEKPGEKKEREARKTARKIKRRKLKDDFGARTEVKP